MARHRPSEPLTGQHHWRSARKDGKLAQSNRFNCIAMAPPLPDPLTLPPIARVAGRVQLPGSKSLSNRALLLAALARGTTTIDNLLDSDDVTHMRAALTRLGVAISWDRDCGRAQVVGHGGPLTGSPGPTQLFLGNAGTAMRPLTAILCAATGEWTVSGEPRMHERPIGDLVDALRLLGGDITYLGDPGFPPLQIHGRGLTGGITSVSGAISSQFLTALLLAAPLAGSPVTIDVTGEMQSKPYIDITIALMARFGVVVEHDGYRQFRITPQPYVSPGQLLVEGDASSASYFLAAAAVAGGTVQVDGIGTTSIQGDLSFTDVLEAMGARVERAATCVRVSRGPQLRGVDLDLNHIPDAAMTAAVLGLFTDGTTTIRNIGNWRVKETDRLTALATELRRCGASVEEGRDYIAVTPPRHQRAATVDTWNDHRMAMCLSLAALGPAPITIRDPGCVSKTFPDYFERFAEICHKHP